MSAAVYYYVNVLKDDCESDHHIFLSLVPLAVVDFGASVSLLFVFVRRLYQVSERVCEDRFVEVAIYYARIHMNLLVCVCNTTHGTKMKMKRW